MERVGVVFGLLVLEELENKGITNSSKLFEAAMFCRIDCALRVLGVTICFVDDCFDRISRIMVVLLMQ